MGSRLAGGSLLKFSAILVHIQGGMEGWGLCFGVCQRFYTIYISPGLRGGNRLADGSLLMVTGILVRIQAKPEGGGYVLVSFNIFIQCTILPGCLRGTPACQRISTLGYGDFGSQQNGRVGILF